jgi:hypothetical protein
VPDPVGTFRSSSPAARACSTPSGASPNSGFVPFSYRGKKHAQRKMDQLDPWIGFVVPLGFRKWEDDGIRGGWISYQGGDDEAALVGDAPAVAEDPVPVPEDGR